jgi:hypothetical protein
MLESVAQHLKILAANTGSHTRKWFKHGIFSFKMPTEFSTNLLVPYWIFAHLPGVTRHPVFNGIILFLSELSWQIWNRKPYSPVFSNGAILFRSYMKIVRYTSNMDGRHMFAIHTRNTSNWQTDHYFLSAKFSRERIFRTTCAVSQRQQLTRNKYIIATKPFVKHSILLLPIF